MTKGLIAGALTLAATFAALHGCDAGDEVELRTSALAGSGGPVCGAGGASATAYRGVHGFNLADGTHAAVYRDANDVATQVTGTPLANPTSIGASLVAQRFTPSPYVRHDGTRVVLYVSGDKHIHEIDLPGGGDWDFATCCGIDAPLAAKPATGRVPDVLGYVRSDNHSAFVYRRDSDNHVIEVASNFGSNPPWLVNDLTALSGATVTATGSAFPYVRSDGTNSVVYTAGDSRLHELTGTGTPLSWVDWDLYANSGETQAPSSDPWAYKRSDGVNSVVFIAADNKLHELYFSPGGSWHTGILPAVLPTGGAVGRPSGYTRPDNVNAVAYVSNGNSIHEVELWSLGWTDVVLPKPTCAIVLDPVFAHTNGSNASILFYGTNSGVNTRYELSQPTGGSWTLQTF